MFRCSQYYNSDNKSKFQTKNLEILRQCTVKQFLCKKILFLHVSSCAPYLKHIMNNVIIKAFLFFITAYRMFLFLIQNCIYATDTVIIDSSEPLPFLLMKLFNDLQDILIFYFIKLSFFSFF